MWSPEDQYPHRAGRAFEEDLNLAYLAPGAFTIIRSDAQRPPPDPPMAMNRHRLTPTARKRRDAAFAIIAEAGSSNPGSRSPSPTGRVSPFRGRGFNPTGSRHASPLPSPPPTATPRRSKIPLARRDSTAQMFDPKNNSNLTKQLSKSLTNISPRRVSNKPPSGRYTKGPAFQKLSPIVGSSPEQTPHQQGAGTPSKIPRSQSQPPSRTTSRTTSRNGSRNVSRESSPSKLSLTKVNYKHVKAKVNSFNVKPKVPPPKPTQVPSDDSTDSTSNSYNIIKTEAAVEKTDIRNNNKRSSVKSALSKTDSKNGNKTTNNDSKTVDNPKTESGTENNNKTNNDEQVQNQDDNTKVSAQKESTPTLIDLLAPSTTTVVSSTTTTVTQPLKIDAKLELDTKDDVYLPDARALSATSVSAAMNRMNDTVLDTKTLMKETKLINDARNLSARSVITSTNETQPTNVTNTRNVTTLVDTERAPFVLPPVETKDSKVNNKSNHISVGNHNNNTINGKMGVVTDSALPKSANERIKEARTVVAADVQPLRITVKEKPSNADVQSGNVRINLGVVNGINNHPGLPPPQSPQEQPPTQQEPPSGCCARLFKCSRNKTKPPDTQKSTKNSSCFCLKKKDNNHVNKGNSDLNLIENQNDEVPKKWWQRLSCQRNKVGDSTSGCFPRSQRKESWVLKTPEDSMASEGAEKRSARDICKNFLRTIFCINLCTRKRRKREAEEAMRRRASVLSKKKSLTPAPPEEPKYRLEASLVEHSSVMKGAIPVLPLRLAWMCLILNSILPGTGTITSGFLCLCIGKARFNQKDGFRQRFGAFIIDLLIGCGQAFTVLFCLVGWGWSVWWGIIMLKIAKKHDKIRRAEKAMEEDRKKQSTSENPQMRDPERGGS